MSLIHSDTLLRLVTALVVLTTWVGLAGVARDALRRFARRGRACGRPGRPPVHATLDGEPRGENMRHPVHGGAAQHTRS